MRDDEGDLAGPRTTRVRRVPSSAWSCSVSVRPPRPSQLPALSVLVLVGLGLLLAAQVDWALGARVIGLAFLLAACLRLTLPAARAGWLAVRTRPLDAALLVLLGAAALVLAQTIPRAQG